MLLPNVAMTADHLSQLAERLEMLGWQTKSVLETEGKSVIRHSKGHSQIYYQIDDSNGLPGPCIYR